jgi:predicted RNase H-like HicB family nuclease
MQLIYPAVFHKNSSGTYDGYFPDLDQCTVHGETLDEATNAAIHAALEWVNVELEDEEFSGLPPVSDKEDIELKDGEFIRNIAFTLRLFDGYDE